MRAPTAAEPLLVPMVSDAIRAVDVERGGSRSTSTFLGRPSALQPTGIEGAAMEIDVFTLFPSGSTGSRAAPRRATRCAAGTRSSA